MTPPPSDLQLSDLKSFYERQLLENILPFWLKHARDDEGGGYFTCLERDGKVFDADKLCLWSQGRIAWTFAWLYNEWRQEPAWLEFARRGVDFLLAHGFSESGRMYYATRQDGVPLLAGQDYFTELSTVLAFSEVARATGDHDLRQRARELFDRTWATLQDPDGDWNPFLPGARPCRIHGYSMITLNVLQQLRRAGEQPEDASRIDLCLESMLKFHLKPDQKLLLEMVAPDGTALPGNQGRWVNPGHMIEGGTFLIHEARHRSDPELRSRGLDLIRWGFGLGWDTTYGGIFNDVDSEGHLIPGQRAMVADSKLWWQHAEALYGLALGFVESGDAWFWEKYRLVHEYSFNRFADLEHGEWYALLDRTGRPIDFAKGTDRKNVFHIGRNFFWCSRLTGGA